jgi:asparagine synthase (glutamine-hydrolysing)
MCGIAGFIDLTKNSSHQILRDCTDVLSHRGPDGSGYEFFENDKCQVGIGHRRLSVIDLSNAANQPMRYKNLCITFNGEIYNYQEIRTELEILGHFFITHSDTEVILHAWEQWKEEMAKKFTGMFAFVIYDLENEKIYAFRDRGGVKPFFYYWKDGLFMFTSELKSFHKHPRFSKSINRQALFQFLQYGYIIAPLSIFENTYKLLPGHLIQFDIGGGTFKIKKFYEISYPFQKTKVDISESEAKEHTTSLLKKACEYRMVADVPVGVFLSGGYDSTAITAILQANRNEKLKTFTIGFFEDKYNEANFARRIAQHLRTDHTEYYCTTREAQEIIPEIPFISDEPFGDASLIPTTLVSRLARKEVTVSLSADGGDELFGGYPKYTLSLDFLRNINAIPHSMRKTSGKILESLPKTVLSKILANDAAGFKKRRIARLIKNADTNPIWILNLLFSQTFDDEQMKFLFREDFEKANSWLDIPENNDNINRPLDGMLLADYKTYLPDDILCKVDRASMSQSLESREPLLDHNLIEFVASLPPGYKIFRNQKKYLLKQIVHDYVPKELMERPKMGFGVPVSDWMRGDLKYLLEEFMQERDFQKHDLFNWKEVQNIRDQFFAGDKNYQNVFWYLLIFQMWYKTWMD